MITFIPLISTAMQQYYIPGRGFCETFNCDNTALATSGSNCLVSFTEALAFGYRYAQLPCDGGCNLCPGNQLISNRRDNFTDPDSTSRNCNAAQLDALTGSFDDPSYCTTFPPTFQESCGCVDSGSSSSAAPSPMDARWMWSGITLASVAAVSSVVHALSS